MKQGLNVYIIFLNFCIKKTFRLSIVRFGWTLMPMFSLHGHGRLLLILAKLFKIKTKLYDIRKRKWNKIERESRNGEIYCESKLESYFIEWKKKIIEIVFILKREPNREQIWERTVTITMKVASVWTWFRNRNAWHTT